MRWISAPLGARYINRQVLGIFLAALAVLLTIALGDKLIQLMEKAAAGDIPADKVFYIVMLRIPELAQMVMPFALYMGLIMGLSRLYSSQEMSVLRSGGLSTPTLLLWLAPAILFVSTLVAFSSLIVTPMAKQAFERELFELQKNAGIAALQPGIFRIENSGRQVTFSDAIGDDKQTILDVFIQRRLDDGRQMMVWAERGQRSDPDAQGRQLLTLENGRRYVGRAGSPRFEVMSFGQLSISIDTEPVLERVRDIQSMDYADLGGSLAHQAEWHWRIGWPLFVPSSLLACELAVQPRQGRYGWGAMVWMLTHTGTDVNHGSWSRDLCPVSLVYGPHMVFGLVAARNLYTLATYLAVVRQMRDSTYLQRFPLWLGYSGLLPMSAFLAGWFWPQLTNQLVFMATLVGTIFSFLGGIQWGFAVNNETRTAPPTANVLRFVVGVMPALITFVALVIPRIYGGVLLVSGLWLLLVFEWQRHASTSLPDWYLPLRINLTILLCGLLAAVLWFSDP